MSRDLNPYLLTLPELMSAKKKIGGVAAFYDPLKISFRGFDSTALDPTQFREQLRRNLGVHLTDAELGAIVFLFDKDGDGKVDSVEFINEFFRLGKIEHKKFMMMQKDEKIRIGKWQRDMEALKMKRFESFSHIKIATEWTPEQEKSAIRKIAKVAFCYDNTKGGLEVKLFSL